MNSARATAVADQLDAASTDARLRMVALVAHHDTVVTPAATTWVAAQFADLDAAMRAKTVRCCPHLAAGPTVVYAAAWTRWALACTRCIRLLQPTANQDSVCDRCQHHAAELYQGVAADGPVLLMFALCPRCTGRGAGA